MPFNSLGSVPTHFELAEKFDDTTKNLPDFSFHILCLTWFDHSSKSKWKFLAPGKCLLLGHAGRMVGFIFLKTMFLTLSVLYMF